MSDTVTIKLNGNEVTIPNGSTVMQAANKAKVSIPHFCYHEGLSVAGVCRFCMVKVAGRPRMEIACNLIATEGMEVDTESDEVKEVHKWGLELHLVNHPLDCPVCDQAGECELQNSYMEVGKYESKMSRPKVLKPKKLDVGEQLVLDTERCILCSRCVRFEDEITKTGALGIFDRGDRSIIGTYKEEKINHKYQENLVDVCPVGAFTSKEFRFKQRVWFLKEKDSICPGCSTGCHVSVHGKPEVREYFRVKPRFSKEVNGHWMCDEGRHTYRQLNLENRLSCAWRLTDDGVRVRASVADGLSALATKLKSVTSSDKLALLLSAQYTTEEYEAIVNFFTKELGGSKVYQWRQPDEDRDAFDGLLLRGDKNSNTSGLLKVLKDSGVGGAAVKNEFEDCLTSGAEVVIAIAPENASTFPSLKQDLAKLGELPFVSVWSVNYLPEEVESIGHALPLKGFAEKTGSFVNFDGKSGKLADPFPSVIAEAKAVDEFVVDLKAAMEVVVRPEA